MTQRHNDPQPAPLSISARPVGVVLAGGLARRMGGGDKCMLPLGGRSLLDHVCARLAAQTDALALNANGDPARFAEPATRWDFAVAPDDVPDFPGPLAGVLAGIEWAAAQGRSHIVTAAADTPFFPADLVERLIAAAAAEGTPLACAATPDADGVLRDHPTFGLWPTALAADLRRALVEEGVRKIVAWTDRHGCARAAFPVGAADPFFNVNTPDDMRRAETLLGEVV